MSFDIKSEEDDVKRQIAAELQRLVSSLEQNVTIAKVRVDTLQRRLNSAKTELAQSNRGSVELNDLERDAEASRQLYKEFLDRFKQTNELEGITDADALINSEAPVPSSPSFPRTSLNLALGAMLGFALAAFVGLVTELLDSYLSSPEEVERVTGAPYIGQIPLLPATGNFTKAKIKPAEYLLEKPHSGFAEAFRNLRASIMFADIDKAAKTVAVVSSLPDEGKTSMTYCLGRMAAMSGTKTIVIDGDIRRRQLTEISGVPAEVGLLEYLFGETRLADAIAVDEKTGLHILPLTDRKHTPRDVFGSRAFDALLNMLQQTYDLIIIDTGPILLLAETRVVTRKVDQVVGLRPLAEDQPRRAARNDEDPARLQRQCGWRGADLCRPAQTRPLRLRGRQLQSLRAVLQERLAHGPGAQQSRAPDRPSGRLDLQDRC